MSQVRLLGINGYEAKVYQALITLGKAKVADLANIVSVPRPHIYTALRALSRRGLVTASKGKVSIFSVVSPDAAFRSYLESERTGLKTKEETIKALAELHRASHKRVKTSEPVEVIGSEPSSFYEIQSTIADARQEVLSLLGQPFNIRSREPRSKRADELEKDLLRRGIKVRCLYNSEVLEDEYERQRIAPMLLAGEQARVTDRVPTNIIVVDDRMATLSVFDESRQVTVYRFNDPCLVQTQRLAFEQLWQSAEEFSLEDTAPVRRRTTAKTRKVRKKGSPS